MINVGDWIRLVCLDPKLNGLEGEVLHVARVWSVSEFALVHLENGDTIQVYRHWIKVIGPRLDPAEALGDEYFS